MAIKVRKDKLLEVVKNSGLKFHEFAYNVGVTQNYLYRIKNEGLTVGNKLIEGLIRISGLSFDELFYFEQEKTQNELTVSLQRKK
ncbi:MAG: hypothetical protein GX429_01720 [Bacteroidales bacterium]|nr:hypothetical protein [Bacteroidales bacterium]